MWVPVNLIVAHTFAKQLAMFTFIDGRLTIDCDTPNLVAYQCSTHWQLRKQLRKQLCRQLHKKLDSAHTSSGMNNEDAVAVTPIITWSNVLNHILRFCSLPYRKL